MGVAADEAEEESVGVARERGGEAGEVHEVAFGGGEAALVGELALQEVDRAEARSEGGAQIFEEEMKAGGAVGVLGQVGLIVKGERAGGGEAEVVGDDDAVEAEGGEAHVIFAGERGQCGLVEAPDGGVAKERRAGAALPAAALDGGDDGEESGDGCCLAGDLDGEAALGLETLAAPADVAA